MKTRVIILVIVFFTCISSTKTIKDQIDSVKPMVSGEEWLNVAIDVKDKPEEFFQKNKEKLQIDMPVDIKLDRTKVDEFGNRHYYYKQFYNGVPVELSTIIVHENKGIASLINGKFHKNIDINTTPKFPKKLALQEAIKSAKAEKFAWESDSLEKEIKVRYKNESATWLPEGKLVVLNVDNKYLLAYKFEIYSIEPYDVRLIYIDANTGEVIRNQTRGFKATGSVNTLFNGNRNFTTKYRGLPFFNFILLDDTRGYICTKDYADWRNALFGWGGASHRTDHDNTWNDDEYRRTFATAQWAGEMVWDYYRYKHYRYGIGGSNNVDLRIAAYAGEDNTGWWPDYADSDILVLGVDSDKDTEYYQSVALDLIGHEFTHGVICHETDIEVDYAENGALVESFCDIFGTMVERYVEGTSADWQFSEDTYGTYYLRDMSNPFYAQQPHTRGGTYWLSSAGCPTPATVFYCTELVPYTNMGVQNYWFYLLSQGGVHNGVTVGSIGADKAARIAYYTMCYYFNANSLYDDVRNGSIESARTLYGECSNEYYQVQNAWAAVGVGAPAGPCMDVQISGYTYLLCGEYEYYYADVAGGSGNYSYQWYVDGYPYSNDSYIYWGYYPPYETETHYMSVTVTSGSASDSDDLYVFVESCEWDQNREAQNESNNESLKLNVYPNPATDEITVNLHKEEKNGLPENYSVRIIDMQGIPVYQNIITTDEDLRIDISKLKTGNYHLILSNKNSNNVVLSNQFLKK